MLIAGIWESLVISLAAASVAYWRRFLTIPAAIAAAILGGIILALAGWAFASTTAGLFLITALLSERQVRLESGETNGSDQRRNLNQIIANGILLGALAVLHRVTQENSLFLAAYLGCAGAVAGDTWATGATQFTTARPRLLTSRRPVPAGTPGAVSSVGIVLTALAGLCASLLYLFVAIVLAGATVSIANSVTLTIAAITGAVTGSLFDSYLGAACQALYTDAQGVLTDQREADDSSANAYVRGWRWLSNDLVNFSNSIAGALAALVVWAAASWLDLI